MKKIMRRIISISIILVMILGMMTTFATDYETKEGEFFAFQFSPNENGLEHIQQTYKINYTDLKDQGVKVMAKTAKNILDAQPEGQRCIDLNLVSRYMTDDSENYLWWDVGVERMAKLLDEFFGELKKNGGQLDYVIDDFEGGMSNWAFNHNADRLPKIVADPRYETEIRPLLVEAGFTFSDYGETELQYLVDFGKSNAYNIWNGVMSRRVKDYYRKAVTEPLFKHYPDVKNSNYGMAASLGEEKVLYDLAGHKIYQGGKSLYAGGTHSSPILYSRISQIGNKGRAPEGYPYETFQINAYNALIYAMVHASDAVVSTEGGNFMPWIPNKSWTSSKYSNSMYYDEVMFHLGLMNADPFLVFNHGGTTEDEPHLNNVFKELNTVVGNGKRKTLVEDQVKWDQRYVLTGLELEDKNIWRITPDLYTPGITIENFLSDSKNMIFQIGNQVVDFPEGSKIVDYKSMSEYGYWITSPKGTRPVELRVEGIEIPGEPIKDESGLPGGYTVKKTYAKYDPNAPVTAPDKDENLTSEPTKPAVDTSKVANHWAARALNKAVADGLIVGSDKGLEPGRNVTKAELITMMLRANGIENNQNLGPQWYSDAANKAVSLGWTNYLGDVEYDINRAASAGIIANAMKISDAGLTGKTFTDDAQIDATGYLSAVRGCVSLGIITGYPDGSFKPLNTITRAEAVVIIQRAFY